MNEKIKSILGNGLPWALAIFALGCMIGYVGKLGTKNTLKTTVPFAVATLLVSGVLYRRFSKPVKALEKLHVQIDEPELLILQAPANHLIEGSLVPGKLFLTDKRIIFKPLKIKENEPQEYTWHVTQLEPAAFYKSIWNAGGEFLLKTGGEIPEMFEVDKLKPWKEALKSTGV